MGAGRVFVFSRRPSHPYGHFSCNSKVASLKFHRKIPGAIPFHPVAAAFEAVGSRLFGNDVKFLNNKKILLIFFLLLLIACPSVCLAQSDKAKVSALELDKSGKVLKISFSISNCFNSAMEEAVRDGVPTTFRILVSVEKPSLVLTTTMVDLTLLHTIKYNRLNEEFQVTLPESGQEARVTKSFKEAKKWMATVKNLPVIPTCWLNKDQTYYLNVKAELSKVELPLIFRYIIFWASLWDFETGWRTVEFLY